MEEPKQQNNENQPPLDDTQVKMLNDTQKQIKNSKVHPTRNLLRLQFIKKRKDFHQTVKFTETDSDRNHQFQSFKDDNLGLKENKVMQIGLQGSQPYQSTASQTYFKRKINKCIQIRDSWAEPQVKVKDADLIHFLDNVYQQMEEALQSIETIDIFQNDFDVLPQNQGGNKETSQISNNVKQTKNLFYLKSKGKKVSCIQFQPWLPGKKNLPIIAESFVENLSFDERVVFSMKSSKSYILFWNYEDMHAIDPLLILESPLEILSFQFNPKDPNFIIAGTINGQVVMWDLKNIQLGPTQKKKMSKVQKSELRQISPVIISALQDPSNTGAVTDQMKKNVPSHKAPVMCVKWFPVGLQIEIKKSYSALTMNLSDEMNQFASISSDGQVLLWQKKFLDSHKKPVNDLSQFVWKAGYGFHLFRPQGGGAMGGAYLAFKKNQKNSIFTGASDQGELFVCDWAARSADEAGSKNDTILAYWNQERSYRPVVALDLLPSNEDIILTVYDFHFCVWKTSVDVPLFNSMITKGCSHTCGNWSPSRAGVLFIGKSNGTIDIWDFMDQSQKWTMQYSVGSVGISSMKFHENNPNILAVGSQQGSLHILELPFTLLRKVGDEDKTMNEYWDREIESVKYFNKRFDFRFEESQQLKAKQDQEERIRIQKGDKKDKRDEEQQIINREYLEFSQDYLNEFIYKIPAEKPDEKDKKKQT